MCAYEYRTSCVRDRLTNKCRNCIRSVYHFSFSSFCSLYILHHFFSSSVAARKHRVSGRRCDNFMMNNNLCLSLHRLCIHCSNSLVPWINKYLTEPLLAIAQYSHIRLHFINLPIFRKFWTCKITNYRCENMAF